MLARFSLTAFVFLVESLAYASETSHSDPIAPILLGLIILFTGAKAGGFVANKVGQPVVLGELLAGVVLGNLTLFGFEGLQFLRDMDFFASVASLGAILLLFEVGLESSVGELLKVGVAATIVAIVGVIFPFILGYGVSCYFLPQSTHYVHSFLGATLCATSVGITARVLKDLNKIHTKEAKIILGAAVIDDVLGLIILAVVSGIIVSASKGSGDGFSMLGVLMISTKAIGFLIVALFAGIKFAPMLFKIGARLRVEGVLVTLSLSFCFLLAYLANLAGLAPIVGAFAAGLIIDGDKYAKFFGEDEMSIEHLIFPLSKFFVPVFFIHMGMQVELATLSDLNVVGLGLALTLVAILGKQVCGLGVFGKENSAVSRLTIGIGMIPRGEVGLIFAAIGAGLLLDGERIITPPLYSAIIIMVMITTLLTPPALKWALQKKPVKFPL
ncbi:MAG: cation:proton antiporter [Deltaproteobacteria bacterium]|nr:cation:proton antiporter [Deltaproteobacteria bacterium]